MADKENEAILNHLNLNPQCFVNEVLNHLDYSINDAFTHFYSEASTVLKDNDTNKSQDLKKGIDYIQKTVQTSMDKRLVAWETYCLHHVFTVPSGFFLPVEDEEASDHDFLDQDNPSDEQVEAQLDTLRSSLAGAEKECAELEAELEGLKRSSAVRNQYISSVNEALELYEQSSSHEMLQEMLKIGSELRLKVEQLKSKQMEELERSMREQRTNANGDMPEFGFRALSKMRLDELQDFADQMKF